MSGRPYSRAKKDLLTRALLLTLLTIATLLLVCAKLSAQATSGTITGEVIDQSGAVIPNATVTITDTQRASSVTTTSNAQGLFTRTQLANGLYNVRVVASGFNTSQQNNIVVNVDRETRVDVTLQPGNVQQTVSRTMQFSLRYSLHLSLSLPATMPVSKALQLVKAGSSKFLNEQMKARFEWQEG